MYEYFGNLPAGVTWAIATTTLGLRCRAVATIARVAARIPGTGFSSAKWL